MINQLRNFHTLDMFIMNSKRLYGIRQKNNPNIQPAIVNLKFPLQKLEDLDNIYNLLAEAHDQEKNLSSEENPLRIRELGKQDFKNLYLLFLEEKYSTSINRQILDYLGNPKGCEITSAVYQPEDTIESLVRRLK